MKSMPTIEKLRSFISYDSATGEMTNLIGRGGVKAGKKVGGLNLDGYVQLMVCGYMFLGHRLAWMLHYGEAPKYTIDHIDGNKSNNRIENLRDVPYQVNNQNIRRAFKSCKSGVLGASPSLGRFRACIKVNGKFKHLGRFDTAEEANRAYVAAKRAYHEGNTL